MSLNLISAEVTYRNTSSQNPAPAVYSNPSQQQQHGPRGKSQQHPYGYSHDIAPQRGV